jgi:hypothetical protein
MSELKKVIVVSVEEDDISVKMQVALPDYSAIYEATAFKKSYNSEDKEWTETDEAQERFKEALEVVGGSFEGLEDKELELWLEEATGKAYFKEGKAFLKIEKPLVSLKRIKKAPIVEIKDSPKGRAVVIEHKGIHYAFNFNSGVWVEKVSKFIPNAAKLAKAKARFNEVFEEVGIDWDTAELAIGMVVDCTVEQNQLAPKSPEGWLKPLPLDPDDQPNKVDLSEEAEDLPF